MPHGHCYLWSADILWTSVVSDSLIAIAYYTIPAFLIYLVYKRKDLVFNWIFVMFALFIIACGTTHVMDIWTVWHPDYAIQGLIKLFTAGVSVTTAIALVPLIPKVLTIPSVKDIEDNRQELLRLNGELTKINLSLEQRVEEKTRDVAGLAAIVQCSNDAIIGEDANGLVTSWNPSAQKLYGFAESEVLGKSISKFIVPEELHSEMDAIKNRTKDGETTEVLDTVRMTKDGRRVEVSITFSPLKDSNGKFIGSSSIARDVTLRKKTERRLLRSEMLFSSVIESTPNGILMVDQKGKIALCNKEFELLFGYDRNEMIGREMEFLVPERFRQAHPHHRNTFFKKPETRQMGIGRDLFGLRKDGSEFPVEIGLNPMVTDEGSFVLASVVDISKRKTLEERIRHSADAIQQKNQEMEQFVYTVSHDLKSPLVTSSGFLGLLKEDILAKRYDKLEDSFARLERANSRMGQLINDLLQLSRIGRIKLEIEKIDFNILLNNIVENLSSQIKEKHVEVVVQPLLPFVKADRKRVYQIFENLIINSLKYGSSGLSPRIDIGYQETDSEFLFYVKDNGPGISEEYHKKIFGLFQRLENDNRGTGVGLTIVSRAMQIHGGRVWVDSKLGAGATFWLAFPKSITQQVGAENEL